MAVFSIISRAKLDGPIRIDAEFYHPANEALLSQLSMCNDLRTIGNCATVITDMGAFSLYRKDYFVQQGVPFLRVENIKDNFLDLSDVIYISPEYHAKLAKSQVKPRDVLLTTKAIIGFACTVPENIGDCNMSQNLVRIRFKDFLNPYYVSTFLSSKYGSFQSKRLATGNVQLYLNYQNISRILIPIFSADFQNQIENQVKGSEINLHKSQQLLVQAEQLLLSELGLRDWKPRHTLTYVRSFSQVAQASRMDAEYFQPKYEEMFDRLPSSVCLQQLGKLATYTKGIEVGCSAYTDSGIPFWRVSNLTKYGIDDSTVNFINTELYNSFRAKYEPQQGEILLSKDATPGIAYYLEEPIRGIVSSGILRLSLINDIPPHYLETVSTFYRILFFEIIIDFWILENTISIS